MRNGDLDVRQRDSHILRYRVLVAASLLLRDSSLSILPEPVYPLVAHNVVQPLRADRHHRPYLAVLTHPTDCDRVGRRCADDHSLGRWLAV